MNENDSIVSMINELQGLIDPKLGTIFSALKEVEATMVGSAPSNL